MFDHLRRHRDNPMMSYLRDFLSDLLSEMENAHNDVTRQLRQLVQEGIKPVTELVDKLTAAVADQADKIAAHDAAVQAGLAEIKALVGASGMTAADAAAISAAIDKIAAGSAIIAGESKSLSDALPAVNPAPADPAAPVTTA